MEHSTAFILIVILIAYAFDFINGFHDAANSIATIVSTGVLTPRQAVLWAAFFNFIAFFFFNLMVAKTIGHGLIDIDIIDATVILAALISAIIWNLFTWFFGLPSSSSHALIGGLAGAAMIRGGIECLKLSGFLKVGLGLLLSPLLGLFIALGVSYVVRRCLSPDHEQRYTGLFKGMQLASSALLSMSHGGNDAQKTMGIIALLLFSASWIHGPFYIPWWVVLSCQTVISLGTLAGGWRIVYTLGQRITALTPLRGSIAETSAAAIILISTELGIPVSTTQTVTGAIAGVGFSEGLQSMHWPILKRIMLAWAFTIPASGLIAAGIIWMTG